MKKVVGGILSPTKLIQWNQTLKIESINAASAVNDPLLSFIIIIHKHYDHEVNGSSADGAP